LIFEIHIYDSDLQHYPLSEPGTWLQLPRYLYLFSTSEELSKNDNAITRSHPNTE